MNNSNHILLCSPAGTPLTDKGMVDDGKPDFIDRKTCNMLAALQVRGERMGGGGGAREGGGKPC